MNWGVRRLDEFLAYEAQRHHVSAVMKIRPTVSIAVAQFKNVEVGVLTAGRRFLIFILRKEVYVEYSQFSVCWFCGMLPAGFLG